MLPALDAARQSSVFGGAGKVGNVVFMKTSTVQSLKEARARLLTLLQQRRCAVGLDRTSYGETVTKDIILCDFSLERWGFSKPYDTDSVSTGFKQLE